MRFYLMPLLFLSFIFTQAQESNKIEFYNYNQLEHPPLYQDCTNANSGVCTFSKITAFIQKEFDKTLLTDSISEKERIMVATFFIDTSGNAVRPIVHGKNKKLTRELARVIKKIPALSPGKKNKKHVNTVINLPIKVYKETAADSIYSVTEIDISPIYKGCEKEEDPKLCTSTEVQNFLMDHANLNKIKSTKGQWLKTAVHFTVDERGKVVNVTANGINKSMNEEAIRIIKKLHDFTPGKLNGKNVKVSYYLPIMLQIASH